MNEEIRDIVDKTLKNIEGLTYNLCFWEQETKLVIIYNTTCCSIIIDNEALSIYGLYTEEESRKSGNATRLFKIIEDLAKALNRKELFLFCKPNTWQYEWYIRIGFKYYLENSDIKGTVWLYKILS